MIKVEPDLPKPSAQPTTFFHGTSNRLFVEGWLATTGVEIDEGKQAIIWRKDVVDSVEQHVEIGNLRYVAWISSRI